MFWFIHSGGEMYVEVRSILMQPYNSDKFAAASLLPVAAPLGQKRNRERERI